MDKARGDGCERGGQRGGERERERWGQSFIGVDITLFLGWGDSRDPIWGSTVGRYFSYLHPLQFRFVPSAQANTGNVT